MFYSDSFFGIKLHVDDLCVSVDPVFPQERFVEYGPEDEWWLKKYGNLTYRTRPAAYRTGLLGDDTIMIHPDLLAHLRKEFMEAPQWIGPPKG